MAENERAMDEDKPKEEKAIVLDFLEYGYALEGGRMPVVQALGLTNFSLLELVPKKDVILQPHKEVYIGDGKRDEIYYILGRLPREKLTETAKGELPSIIEGRVKIEEARFVTFFNIAHPLSLRMHQLELLPGMGKKHMLEVLEQRKEKPFESFEEIKERIKLMPNPQTMIMKRILNEMQGKEKHRIFVR